MNAKEFAAMLNGREYTKEISKAESQEAKAAGLIVAFGASDDNLEFRGACYDEVSAYNGTEAKIRLDNLEVADDEEGCPVCLGRAGIIRVHAKWCPKDLKASWLITASVPFEPFDIMEDGELFCRGAVIPVPQPVDQQSAPPAEKVGSPVATGIAVRPGAADEKIISKAGAAIDYLERLLQSEHFRCEPEIAQIRDALSRLPPTPREEGLSSAVSPFDINNAIRRIKEEAQDILDLGDEATIRGWKDSILDIKNITVAVLDHPKEEAKPEQIQNKDKAEMDKLCAFILMNFTGEWHRNESAADVAIRYLNVLINGNAKTSNEAKTQPGSVEGKKEGEG